MEKINISLPLGYAQQLLMEIAKKYPRMRYEKDGFLGIRFLGKTMLDKFLEGLHETKWFIVKCSGFLYHFKVQEVQEKEINGRCQACGHNHSEIVYDVCMHMLKVTKNGIDVTEDFWENGSQSEEVIGRSAIVKRIKKEAEEMKKQKEEEEPEIYS